MAISDERAWRELFEAAFLEPNPSRLVERIQLARSAIQARIDSTALKTPDEQTAMRKALNALETLANLANRDINK